MCKLSKETSAAVKQRKVSNRMREQVTWKGRCLLRCLWVVMLCLFVVMALHAGWEDLEGLLPLASSYLPPML